jgi:hypothetical protein
VATPIIPRLALLRRAQTNTFSLFDEVDKIDDY